MTDSKRAEYTAVYDRWVKAKKDTHALLLKASRAVNGRLTKKDIAEGCYGICHDINYMTSKQYQEYVMLLISKARQSAQEVGSLAKKLRQ